MQVHIYMYALITVKTINLEKKPIMLNADKRILTSPRNDLSRPLGTHNIMTVRLLKLRFAAEKDTKILSYLNFDRATTYILFS